MKLLHCYKCKSYKPNNEFYPDRTRSSGLASKCRICNNTRKRIRKRKATLRAKQRILAYVKNYYKKYPERNLAHQLVARALKKGILKKENCKICQSDKNVEGHHKDYSKPLKVVWLCKPHHWQADNNIIKV